ncbi:MAG: glycogen synthase GlgA [Pseudomonadota bacterium]|jgi:starch synthase
MANSNRPALKSKNTLKILFVTPEIHPLTKTGGLADVSAALPAFLRELKADARVLIPGYTQVLDSLKNKRQLAVFQHLPGVGEVRLLSATMPGSGVPLLIIDYPPFYTRFGGPYLDSYGHEWPDNAERFALLSRIGAILGGADSPLPWRPDIVHCNDWQTGLAPAYLHFGPQPRAATVITIHNLAFQGCFPAAMTERLGLPQESFGINGVEYYGRMSFLKAGLYYADHITTVSPTYAEEIQREPLGFGMQGLLASRRDHLTGIVNGIDLGEWDPATDAALARNYNAARLSGKAANKRALQEKLGLDIDPDVPLLGAVSRLTHQKGLDLLPPIVPDLLRQPAQLVVLGSGEAALEQAFVRLMQNHPGKVRTVIGYDEALSHLIEAGSDIFLMPSRFEPCGLNQMYSQRYGTPPVVHATGGLADTVVDTTPDTIRDGTATGFVFRESTAKAFQDAITRAIQTYRDKKLWRRLQRNGMSRDFSWNRSAEVYLELYRSLLQNR